jgi:hypothetical protein
MRGPDGTTTIEPSRMRILLMRVLGAVVAGSMAFGSSAVLPGLL